MGLIVLRTVNYKTEIDIGCAEMTNGQFDLIKNPKVPRNFTHNIHRKPAGNQAIFKIGYHITNMIKSMNIVYVT